MEKLSFVCSGGRITLINLVLPSVSLYYFSFFKAPKKVIKELTRIQRNFLWGGSEEVRKTAWVSWSNICLPKESGGSGIRNMELFNISLLGKWKWRTLSNVDSVWFRLVHRLYGEDDILRREHHSVWWRDLNTLDSCLSFAQNWFHDSIRYRLGNGTEIKFLEEGWCCAWRLTAVFPALFERSDKQIGSVAVFSGWRNRM